MHDDTQSTEVTATAQRPIDIRTQVWLSSEHYQADQLYWDWELGWFEVWSADGEADSAYSGVSVRRDEIDKLETDRSPFVVDSMSKEVEVSPARRGPKPSIRWAALVKGVLNLEREDKLFVGGFDSPRALQEMLQNEIPENQQFDDRTIEGVVSYIYQNLLHSEPPKLT